MREKILVLEAINSLWALKSEIMSLKPNGKFFKFMANELNITNEYEALINQLVYDFKSSLLMSYDHYFPVSNYLSMLQSLLWSDLVKFYASGNGKINLFKILEKSVIKYFQSHNISNISLPDLLKEFKQSGNEILVCFLFDNVLCVSTCLLFSVCFLYQLMCVSTFFFFFVCFVVMCVVV